MARILGVHAIVVYVLASASLPSAHGKGTFCAYFQESKYEGDFGSFCVALRDTTISRFALIQIATRKRKHILIYDQTYVHTQILTISKYNIHLKLFSKFNVHVASIAQKSQKKTTILYVFHLMSNSNQLIAEH